MGNATIPVTVRVQAETFDPTTEIDRLRLDSPQTGAIAAFVGTVRDVNEGSHVGTMFLEHYPGMTERAITEIIETARSRWKLHGVTVVHRVGRLQPTDPIVLVAVGSSHRRDAFEACEFIMDFLKTRAPFWKKESTPEGERWVAARATDEAAAERW